MKFLNEHLIAVKRKFPKEEDRIKALYDSDDDFRTLCEDYFSCMEKLRKFKKEFNEKRYSIEEFKHIQTELEKELQEFLGQGRKS